MQLFIAILIFTSMVRATYFRERVSEGCTTPVSGICNSLPSSQCCNMSRPVEYSIRIANMSSAVDVAVLNRSDFGEQGHPGYIDDEEAALPEHSYHDAYGNLIIEAEYHRLADLGLEHEANGTLHLLYPDLYPPPIEERGEKIDFLVYVDKGCRGENLAVIQEKDRCYNTENGAGIYLNSLPDNCAAAVYPQLDCQGTPLLDIGNGASEGCYDSIDFSSTLVTCS